MAPRRQREAAARRQAANAGRRNQTGAGAARLGPRNQTAATAASTGRPHARNRRSVGDIGNHGNAPVVDGHREANRRCLTRSLSAPPNVAAADESNTIAPAETDTIVDQLMKALDTADAAEAVAGFWRAANQLKERQEEITRGFQRVVAELNQLKSEKDEIKEVIEVLESEKAQKEALVQKVMEELESEKAQRAAEVQKVMVENVRLHAMLDKKEAQLQAMSEQCKVMALNHHN